MTYKRIEIILFFPHHPEVFHYKSYNHLGLVSLIKKINQDPRYNLTIKCHPRHSSKIKSSPYLKILNNTKVVFDDNLKNLLHECDLAIAMESSTAIIDCLIMNKPVFYVSNFSDHFNDEYVYNKLLSHLNVFVFEDYKIIFDKIASSDLNEFCLKHEYVKYFYKETKSEDLELSLNDIFSINSK